MKGSMDDHFVRTTAAPLKTDGRIRTDGRGKIVSLGRPFASLARKIVTQSVTREEGSKKPME